MDWPYSSKMVVVSKEITESVLSAFGYYVDVDAQWLLAENLIALLNSFNCLLCMNSSGAHNNHSLDVCFFKHLIIATVDLHTVKVLSRPLAMLRGMTSRWGFLS